MSEEFRKAADVITALFAGFDHSGMEQANSFLKSWKEIVGDKIAAHARIVDVDRGAVIVEVDHPGWSQQILFRKKQIITSLSRNYPDLEIRNIIMRVVSECKSPYKRQDPVIGTGIPRISDEDINDVEDNEPVTDSMNGSMDENLKAMLEKLKASIKKGKPRE